MKAISTWSSIGVLTAAFAVGCASYRVVQKTPNGGIVALLGDREAAHQKAEQYMASQCPSGYEIVEEGEAVVGQNTSQQSTAGTTVFGAPSVNTSSSTRDATEWRVKYRCKGASAGGDSAPTDKASTPGGSANPPQSSEIHELVIRF